MKIVNAYFRIQQFADTAKIPAVYTNFKMKFGYTNNPNIPSGTIKDTMRTGLTLCYSAPTFSVMPRDTGKFWVKVPLTTAFKLDVTKNLVFDISSTLPDPANGFNLMTSNIDPSSSYMALQTTTDSTKGQGHGNGLDLGFDLAPTAVNEAKYFSAIGLFPNPAQGGRFQVSFDAFAAVKEASIRVSDVIGRVVYSANYRNTGSSFLKEVSLGNVPHGVYLVTVTADEGQFNRMVNVE